jgi:putative resolvase
MSNFIGGKQASELLGVHQRTLMNWDKIGKIETIRTSRNKRLYNVSKFITENTCTNNVCENLDELDSVDNKLKICYIRVSSISQKDDLERQKELMVKNYPNHVIIEEIGSGLNLNKRGIKKLIYLIIDGKVEELVVAYRDRLTRFGFELFEDLIKKYGGACHGTKDSNTLNTNIEYRMDIQKKRLHEFERYKSETTTETNGKFF